MVAVVSTLGALAVLAVLAGLILARRLTAIVAVTGQSMEPTLSAGDRVLVRRTRLRSARAGQLVVIEAPSFLHGDWTGTPSRHDLGRNWMIKRAAAIPGDPVPAVLPAALAGDRTVPDGKLVVLGDNPDMSMDSRYLGYIPGDRLLGVVIGSLPRKSPASQS
jgi:signal peptidase I